ncbi:PRC-barrel domain-containing protein [Pedobacter boryungensis]|uniref:PRC-barrel domain-containing protein n=1 Tax=Pedobacter boryungensis TaxID=869962 RepID=A0ABX2DAT4_9SPHI|nr:PRC-barrel domain-containing protein [Pedobacter boryungensis]NQX31080.1 PRC-barrel domain-containing protein [Pedobacter boryungensis]
MAQHTYQSLKELSSSDFQIVNGEPNIIGWEVKSETGTYIGEVEELLFDPETRSVRYLIIDLDDNDLSIDDKRVMIPIGIAHLHTSDDEVVLPNIHLDQYNALPAYEADKIGPDTEAYIRNVIGSPAALRMEEKMIDFDQQQFYAHQHFDTGSFYQRGGNPERANEQKSIHEMIERSKANNLHAADEHTGENTHHNEQHQIKPWLQPGASHNQGGDQHKGEGDPERPEYQA